VELEYAANPLSGLVAEVEDTVQRTWVELIREFGTPYHNPLTARGSGVRPLLLLLAAECGGGITARSSSLASVVEFLYAASVFHDEVSDDDARGDRHPDEEAKSRSHASILLGDYLLATALSCLDADGNMAFLPDLMGVTARMCKGQVGFLLARGSFLEIPDYLDLVEMKAGSLTAFCARAGLLTADGPPEWAEAFGAFGERFGVAFHIAGEILDLEECSEPSAARRLYGASRGFGLPLVLTAQAGQYERAVLATIAEKDECSPEDLDVVRQLAETSGALSRCWEIADEWLSAALDPLTSLPDTKAKQLLIETTTDLCGSAPRFLSHLE
jgi:heptaprenyl diphosphate synthase